MDDPSCVGAAPEDALACSLRGDDLASRQRWLGELSARALRVTRSESGVSVAFPPDAGLEAELRALTAAEAECCAFLRISVRRADGAVELDVTGPAAAGPIIDQMVGGCP
jgi:hypothetical protein